MIILIGLLLSAIIVAPESIQQEQKAAQNAEQLVRELDQERMDATAYEKNGALVRKFLKTAYKQRGLIPELMDKAPPLFLKITNNGLNINTGKEYTPTQVRYPPNSITWPGMKPDRYYTIIMIDPDMPSRSTPIEQKTQVLHWLMVNIPGALHVGGVGGRQLAPYIGSGPPPGTGIHRYTFLVFDEGNCPKNWTRVEPMDLYQIGKRVNWNFVQPGKPWTLKEFMFWANMGEPIAGNFYQAQYDNWVDQLWRTFDQYYEDKSDDLCY